MKTEQRHPKGRLVEHDPRSANFPVAGVPSSALKSVRWKRRCPIFDQGQLGSCVGNSGEGWRGTDNKWRQGNPNANETGAVQLYGQATHLDQDKSVAYPPTDCGTSGLGMAKALKLAGDITDYHHAFSLQACLTALMVGPVPIGIEWLEAMEYPASDGSVELRGAEVGGHEILIEGYDVPSRQLIIANSWSSAWADHGYFVVTSSQLGTLHDNQGDAMRLTPKAAA